MKRFFAQIFPVLLSFVLNTSRLSADTYYSIGNGSWSSTTSWSTTPGGPSCGCSPISSDDINIYHTISLDKHLTNQGSSLNGITGILTIYSSGSLIGGTTYDIDIRSTGAMDMDCGNVSCRDLTFSNGSIVNVCSSAVLTVNRNFENKNSSDNVTINGTMNVGGSYTNGNGGLIAGAGVINITNGPVNNVGNTYGCTNMNPCSSFPCIIQSPCNFALSTKLISFEAKKSDSFVTLSWSTATEYNNDYFEAERSSDGEHFDAIGRITGSGTTTIPHEYALTDSTPMSGLNYYRIRQVSYDGHTDYSEIKTVTIASGVSFALYPNPLVNTKAQLKVSAEDNCKLSVEIRDYNGRNTYLKKEFQYDNKHTTFNLDELADVPNGVYIAAIKTNQQVYNEMLIIAR